MITIGIFTSCLGFLFMLYAQRHPRAAKTGAITGIYPLFGIIVSFIIFSEKPTPALFS